MGRAAVALTSVDARLGRWRATREGALYACPHCWTGTRTAGRCGHCRRFDVRAVRAPAERRLGPPGPAMIPTLLTSLAEQLAKVK